MILDVFHCKRGGRVVVPNIGIRCTMIRDARPLHQQAGKARTARAAAMAVNIHSSQSSGDSSKWRMIEMQ